MAAKGPVDYSTVFEVRRNWEFLVSLDASFLYGKDFYIKQMEGMLQYIEKSKGNTEDLIAFGQHESFGKDQRKNRKLIVNNIKGLALKYPQFAALLIDSKEIVGLFSEQDFTDITLVASKSMLNSIFTKKLETLATSRIWHPYNMALKDKEIALQILSSWELSKIIDPKAWVVIFDTHSKKDPDFLKEVEKLALATPNLNPHASVLFNKYIDPLFNLERILGSQVSKDTQDVESMFRRLQDFFYNERGNQKYLNEICEPWGGIAKVLTMLSGKNFNFALRVCNSNLVNYLSEKQLMEVVGGYDEKFPAKAQQLFSGITENWNVKQAEPGINKNVNVKYGRRATLPAEMPSSSASQSNNLKLPIAKLGTIAELRAPATAPSRSRGREAGKEIQEIMTRLNHEGIVWKTREQDLNQVFEYMMSHQREHRVLEKLCEPAGGVSRVLRKLAEADLGIAEKLLLDPTQEEMSTLALKVEPQDLALILYAHKNEDNFLDECKDNDELMEKVINAKGESLSASVKEFLSDLKRRSQPGLP